jgi:hypothetical protein
MLELMVVTLSALYFLPFMVAAGREHHSWGWITVANALLGWTGIGWCLVLAWAWYTPANEQAPPTPLRLVHSNS